MTTNLNRYIGLPYKNMGRDFDGVDCYGLYFLIYKEELGIELPDFLNINYSQDWYKKDENHISDTIKSNWIIEVEKPFKKYDGLIFYGIKYKTIANHIGLYIGEGKFIHIMEDTKSMISRLKGFWESKLYKGVRAISG